MNHKKVSKYWDENAPHWIKASTMGCDIWRDHVNSPAFLTMLPDVTELFGLDVGCGEGHHSRLIAKRCKSLTAIDISAQFIAYNMQHNQQANLDFRRANSAKLPFKRASFDFVVATMSFMDMAEIDKVLREIYRVLKPGGFLQFSITHPCFNEYIGHWVTDEQSECLGFLVTRYFMEPEGDIHEWQHPQAPREMPAFQTPRFIRPLAKWLMLLIEQGFVLEAVNEPYADDLAISRYPMLASTRIAAHSLIIRIRK
jgi:ubiquinone/menaquinone biosynthesis C-methylase UbiE